MKQQTAKNQSEDSSLNSDIQSGTDVINTEIEGLRELAANLDDNFFQAVDICRIWLIECYEQRFRDNARSRNESLEAQVLHLPSFSFPDTSQSLQRSNFHQTTAISLVAYSFDSREA